MRVIDFPFRSTYMCICNDFAGARAVKKKINKMDQVAHKGTKIANKYIHKAGRTSLDIRILRRNEKDFNNI